MTSTHKSIKEIVEAFERKRWENSMRVIKGETIEPDWGGKWIETELTTLLTNIRDEIEAKNKQDGLYSRNWLAGYATLKQEAAAIINTYL